MRTRVTVNGHALPVKSKVPGERAIDYIGPGFVISVEYISPDTCTMPDSNVEIMSAECPVCFKEASGPADQMMKAMSNGQGLHNDCVRPKKEPVRITYHNS